MKTSKGEVTILTYIGGSLLGDRRSPESTLDVCDGWWVGASRACVNTWVTLEVCSSSVSTSRPPIAALTDVEGSAKVNFVALCGALERVVGVKNVVGEVRVLLGRAVQVPVRSISIVLEYSMKWESSYLNFSTYGPTKG